MAELTLTRQVSTGSRRNLGVWFAILALGLLGGTMVPVESAHGGWTALSRISQSYGEFCAPHLFHNYERPLLRLPKVRGIPERGHLPFGPSGLELHSIPDSLEFGGPRKSFFFDDVLAGGGEVGYAFSIHQDRSRFQADWRITVQMQLLDHRGAVRREVGHRQIWLNETRLRNNPYIVLKLGPRVGLYRFDIQFANKAKRVLGSFSRYVRVVPPVLKARLGINGHSFQRGEVVATRVENLGTETVIYRDEFDLERFDGTEWIKVRPPDQWQEFRGGAPAGWSGFCSGSFLIPPSFEAGRYRVLKKVRGLEHPGEGPWRNLMAEFDVID